MRTFLPHQANQEASKKPEEDAELIEPYEKSLRHIVTGEAVTIGIRFSSRISVATITTGESAESQNE